MKNKTLLTVVTLSSLMLPVASHAVGFFNDKILLGGTFNLAAKTSITLEQQGGRSIQLNKGEMEIMTEKIKMGLSVLDPVLNIRQNGKRLRIDIPESAYHNSENFTALEKDTGFNYDLYLRKTSVQGKIVEMIESKSCLFVAYGYGCGIDLQDGVYKCLTPGVKNTQGTKKVKTTYSESKEVYKLTIGKSSKVVGEFVSTNSASQEVSSKDLEKCHSK